jgi:VanZ family protein
MSTGTFSAEHTFSVVKIVLGFLFPGLSPDRVMLVHAVVRKAAHVTEYFILSLLLFRAFKAGAGWRWRYFLFAMMGVALWALGDEFHQSFVPSRTASLMDVGIDVAGGALGQLAIAAWCIARLPREGDGGTP